MDDSYFAEASISDHVSSLNGTLNASINGNRSPVIPRGEWNQFVDYLTDKLVEPLSEKIAQSIKKSRTEKQRKKVDVTPECQV